MKINEKICQILPFWSIEERGPLGPRTAWTRSMDRVTPRLMMRLRLRIELFLHALCRHLFASAVIGKVWQQASRHSNASGGHHRQGPAGAQKQNKNDMFTQLAYFLRNKLHFVLKNIDMFTQLATWFANLLTFVCN